MFKTALYMLNFTTPNVLITNAVYDAPAVGLLW